MRGDPHHLKHESHNRIPGMPQNRTAIPALAAGLCALALAMGIGRFGYTALLPAMQVEGLSTADAGAIAAANLFAYMVASWVVGRTPASWWRPGLLACIALSVASTLGMAAEGYGAWFSWRIVGGVASAGTFVLGVGLMLDRLVASGRADWGGFAFCGVGLGIAASGLVALDGKSASHGWIVLGIVAFAAALPALPLGLGRSAAHVDAKPASGGRTSPDLMQLSAAYFLEGVGYSVAATFLVAVVARSGGIALAGWAWVLTGLCAIPGFFLWRRAAARLDVWRALALAYAIQAAAIGLPALSGAPLAAVATAIGFGGTFLAITGLTVAQARHLGGIPAIGRITAIYGVGQALGPFLAGRLAEAEGSFDHALLLSAACVLGGGVILFSHSIRRRKPCPS